MSVNITLTSSMRSNLSSLKSLASQMSTTQTRLSTGKKVNSAIDNANSYYQARALTNRASDLDMLLDSMGQSIQTVTSAVHGLEKSAEMLENAAVIAKEAYEAAIIPEKAWFEAQVGPNGAVVTSAQELKDAINANKETICVYGKIDLNNTSIGLQANQKLVGTEYFTGYTGNKKFSEINNFSSISMITNSLISDLSISKNSGSYGIDVWYSEVNLCNLDYYYDAGDYSGYSAAIIIRGGTANLSGNVNINAKMKTGNDIYVYGGSTLNIQDDAKTYLKSVGSFVGYNQINIGKADVYCRQLGANDINIAEEATITVPQGSFICKGTSIQSNVTYAKLASSDDFDVIDTIDWQAIIERKENSDLDQFSEQYATMMGAYDEMVADSSYQGVNLIKGGKLTTIFNEDRTNSYTINGKDMSTSGLGIITREWQTKDDIAQSIKEIQNAMISIRDEVSRLGNNLSVIETRMNFTDAMCDVLQTGADDLVLANMNEESANYLALQTRNNLAINALSLAAQSNNAVLKLF